MTKIRVVRNVISGVDHLSKMEIILETNLPHNNNYYPLAPGLICYRTENHKAEKLNNSISELASFLFMEICQNYPWPDLLTSSMAVSC